MWDARVHQLHDPRSKRDAFSLIQSPGAKVERYSPKHICTYICPCRWAYSGPWHPGTNKKYVCTRLFIYSKDERRKQLAWQVVTLIRTHSYTYFHQGEAYYLFGIERNRLIKTTVKCLMMWKWERKRERERGRKTTPPPFIRLLSTSDARFIKNKFYTIAPT